jgi:hypothetical protein
MTPGPAAGGQPPARRRGPGRRRVGAWVAALILLAGGGVAASGVASSAQAYDCQGATRCPFVKIENPKGKDRQRPYSPPVQYMASAVLVDADGTPIYHWNEYDPEFTLWHWQYHGGGGEVRIHVHTWSDIPATAFSADDDFTTPAGVSLCLRVDYAGAYQAGGCTDQEDPAN